MTTPPRNVVSRDQYFLSIAKETSQRSKDPSTQVGCVIVDQKNRPISFGYNGFIAGGNEKYLTRERPMKYYFSIHAEMNAILFARRDLEGCKLYATYAPCENCMKFIIQSGIKEVIYEQAFVKSFTTDKTKSMNHPEAFEAASRLILAAEKIGFKIHNINGKEYLDELWEGKENMPNFLSE